MGAEDTTTTESLSDNSGNGESSRIANLRDLVQQLNHIFQSDRVNIETVHQIMKAYAGSLEDWKQYAHFDSDKLTRNLVDTGNGKYNLILVCWEGGHQSTIHDHSGCSCFMRQLQGSLNEIRYEWPTTTESATPLKEASRFELLNGQVSFMNDEIGLHRMENVSKTERAVSLHLYCPPFDTCKVFDKDSGQSIKCPVTFWSKYGKKPAT